MEVVDEVPSLDLGAALDSLIRESLPIIHHADPAKLKTSKTKKTLVSLEQNRINLLPRNKSLRSSNRVVPPPPSSSSYSPAIPCKNKIGCFDSNSKSSIASELSTSICEPISSSVSGSNITLSEAILRNRYTESNQDPFCVHVQRISNPNANLHPISIGKIIHTIMKDEVLEVKKVGYSKVAIFLKTLNAANSLTTLI